MAPITSVARSETRSMEPGSYSAKPEKNAANGAANGATGAAVGAEKRPPVTATAATAEGTPKGLPEKNQAAQTPSRPTSRPPSGGYQRPLTPKRPVTPNNKRTTPREKKLSQEENGTHKVSEKPPKHAMTRKVVYDDDNDGPISSFNDVAQRPQRDRTKQTSTDPDEIHKLLSGNISKKIIY